MIFKSIYTLALSVNIKYTLKVVICQFRFADFLFELINYKIRTVFNLTSGEYYGLKPATLQKTKKTNDVLCA